MQKNNKRARVGFFCYWIKALAKLISIKKSNRRFIIRNQRLDLER